MLGLGVKLHVSAALCAALPANEKHPVNSGACCIDARANDVVVT